MNKTRSTVRGRPRAFEEGAVLASAQRIFLEQGFEATSYDHVAQAVGLAKPSLYNAFGDKAALFDRAVAAYAQHAHEAIIAAFANAPSLHEAGRSVLLAGAEVYSKPDGASTGCLLVGTALPACAVHEAPRRTLSTFIAGLEDALERSIVERFASDARRTGKSPRALALLLTSLLFSLAVRARMGLTRRKLRALAAELAELFA
ncbi:MAG: TetR/AcrR family transcriptional regulator [Alphaproteobacteria bacterium]|nr:TetR/AcrR family transcriptional regulator [Alphaproteobacteria bacterium]